MEKRFNAEVIRTITVNNKVMWIYRRTTKKGVKTYLNYPSKYVTKKHEISKDLALMLLALEK